MGYKIYHVVLKAETPVIIVKTSIKNWYRGFLNYIPGRAIIGSLITRLASIEPQLGRVFRKKPYLNASDFYVEGCLPALPLSIQCKSSLDEGVYIPLDLYPSLIDDRELSNMYSLVMSVFKRIIEAKEYCVIDGVKVDAEASSRNVGGLLISKCSSEEKCLFKRCRGVKAVAIESVGVSGLTGGSRTGLLYTYEAIPPGARYHGFIVVREDSLLSKALDELKGSKEPLLVGRGASRGYGRMTICSMSEQYMGDGVHLANGVEEALVEGGGKNIAFVSLSPFSSCDISDYITRGSCRGDGVISCGLEYYSGWSRLYGTVKPTLRVHRHGCIVYRKFSSLDNFYEFVLSRPGLNFIIPLSLYKRILRW